MLKTLVTSSEFMTRRTLKENSRLNAGSSNPQDAN